LEYDDKNIEAIYFLGRSYQELDDYNKAIGYYSKVIELEPTYLMAYQARGYVRKLMKDYSDAIEDYKKSLEFEPENTNAIGHIANIYARLGNYEEARRYLKRALKYDPDLIIAKSSLAYVEYELGNYEESIKLCYAVIGKLPVDQDYPHGVLGSVYHAINKNDSALAQYNIALSYDPNNPRYYGERDFYNLKWDEILMLWMIIIKPLKLIH